MRQPLTNPGVVASVERAIQEILAANSEWFLTQNGLSSVAINKAEFDFSIAHAHLIFSCWTEKGLRTWRINAWEWSGEKLSLEATRRMGAEAALLELIPRASAKAITAGIAAARQERCQKLAWVANEALANSKIEKAALSPGMRRDQPGRYARIILRLPHERIAVTGTVGLSDARNVDSLFSSALLWFSRLRERSRRPYIERLWLMFERDLTTAIRQRHVLLRDDLRRAIELFEIDDDWNSLTPRRPIERKELWKKRLRRFPSPAETEASVRAEQIIAQAPNAIDLVLSRHGETIRYHGLPFARVRRVINDERVWFGIEGSRRMMLNDRNQEDWQKLWRDLEVHRTATSKEQRHWLYRAAGEAWLESILRRDITRLDPGLIIAPLHAQFRTSHGGPTAARPIDLLALRHDGRLVVIELKVTEDREHVFQGVDYWRRVEAHRRRGHIASAKLFGNRAIADESPLVYLVAPMLHFHPSFATLARTIASDIEIYRFDINEDWRAGVRVVRRTRSNA
jgi:hypothetical protein